MTLGNSSCVCISTGQEDLPSIFCIIYNQISSHLTTINFLFVLHFHFYLIIVQIFLIFVFIDLFTVCGIYKYKYKKKNLHKINLQQAMKLVTLSALISTVEMSRFSSLLSRFTESCHI